jgi:protein-L-isoaspartate(D-aspartate) O-methyltransferase
MILPRLIGVCLLLVVLQWGFWATGDEDPFLIDRQAMVQVDLKARDIVDAKVLKAMLEVRRHLFVDKSMWDAAYNDHPLAVDEGQTISQPYIVALMTQHLKLKPGERVLEIGTGSGYQAAVLAKLTDNVFSIEIREGLYQKAAKRLKDLGYETVKVKWGDGYFGWEEHAPFDAVILTCAVNHVPPSLIKQLKEGGRLILPLGSPTYHQTLTLVSKVGGKTEVEHLSGVRFVPMTGEAEVQGRKQ